MGSMSLWTKMVSYCETKGAFKKGGMAFPHLLNAKSHKLDPTIRNQFPVRCRLGMGQR